MTRSPNFAAPERNWNISQPLADFLHEFGCTLCWMPSRLIEQQPVQA